MRVARAPLRHSRHVHEPGTHPRSSRPPAIAAVSSPYISKVSDDRGRSWTYLRPLAPWPGVPPRCPEERGPGSVLPRLLSLRGALVLAGGRPCESSHDVMLYLNAAGDGEAWQPYSVSYWHNKLVTNRSLVMPAYDINVSRGWPRCAPTHAHTRFLHAIHTHGPCTDAHAHTPRACARAATWWREFGAAALARLMRGAERDIDQDAPDACHAGTLRATRASYALVTLRRT